MLISVWTLAGTMAVVKEGGFYPGSRTRLVRRGGSALRDGAIHRADRGCIILSLTLALRTAYAPYRKSGGTKEVIPYDRLEFDHIYMQAEHYHRRDTVSSEAVDGPSTQRV